MPTSPLASADAVALLRRLCERELSDSEADALAMCCALLPTALQALGCLLARRPDKPVIRLLAELTAARLRTPVLAAKDDGQRDAKVVLHCCVQALSEPERAGLQALCVMPGDFDRSLGDAVAGGDADLLDTLREAGVLDVHGDSGRYRLHDLVRQVVLVDASDEALDAARLRHAKAVQRWLQACKQTNDSAELDTPAGALPSSSIERAHLIAALAWLRGQPLQAERFSSLVLTLGGVGAKLLKPQDRLSWYQAAAESSCARGDRRAQAANLYFEADLMLAMGVVNEAEASAALALDLRRTLARGLHTPQEMRDVSTALDLLGDVKEAQGDWAQAESLYRESLAICRALAEELSTPDARRNVLVSLVRGGDVAQAQGDWALARAMYCESLEIGRALARELNTFEARREVSVLLDNVGEVAQSQGDLTQAEALYGESLAISRTLAKQLNTPESRRDVCTSLDNVGEVAQTLGAWTQAEALYRESLAIRRSLARELNTPQAWSELSMSLDRVGDVAKALDDWAQAKALYRESLKICRTLVRKLKTPEARRDVAISLNRVGEAAQAQGDLAQAKVLYSESLAIRQSLVRELNTHQARRDLGVSFWRLAFLALQQGDAPQNYQWLKEAEAIFNDLAEQLKTPAAERDAKAVEKQLAARRHGKLTHWLH